MECKIYALHRLFWTMPIPFLLATAPALSVVRQRRRHGRWHAVWLALALALGGHPAAWAEKADRLKPWVVEGEGRTTLDEKTRVLTVTGRAVVTRGSLVLRAETIEIREGAAGVAAAVAQGSPQQLATFRQKRDAPNEVLEAQAERIEYDGAQDLLRFTGRALLRILRAEQVVHEVSAQSLTWDNRSEQFTAQGATAPSGATPGRFRWVLTPPEAAASGATPAPTPGTAATPGREGGVRR